MLSRLKFYAKQTAGSLWFRPAAYAGLSLVVLAAPPVVGPFIPWEWEEMISARTNQTILSILASSLLAVSIFSLSAMVAALRAASDAATPRARPLLVADAAAQNAISTFIGAFLFSLLGVVGTLLDVFSPTGRVLLFGVTLALVFVVVGTLIRWLQRLSTLGDVMEAIRRVEQAASSALKAEGAPLPTAAGETPGFTAAAKLHPVAPGFVQDIAFGTLTKICERERLQIQIAARVGDFADAHAPLVMLDGGVNADVADAIRATFTLGDQRYFHGDPRLGLTVLSEIASKALSPGINDPGTAIGAIRAAQRVLDGWGRQDGADDEDCEPVEPGPRVIRPPLSPDEAFALAFGAIAFDGACRPEIAKTLLSVYAGLRAAQPLVFGPTAEAMAADLAARAGAQMSHDADIEGFRAELQRLNFSGPKTAD